MSLLSHRRRNAQDLVIRVGTAEKGTSGSIHKVKRIVQNEKFSILNIDYDFALLELEDTIAFNENTQPIALVDKDRIIRDNTMCLVTGWGNTLSLKESDTKLRGVEVPIVNQHECEDAYDGKITPRMLCAGLEKGGKDACQSELKSNQNTNFDVLIKHFFFIKMIDDSGGPLVVFDDVNESPVLVAVVSWGAGCAEPNQPGVYARITEARDWIYENTGI